MGATGPHFSATELRCHGTGPDGIGPCPGCGNANECGPTLVDALEALRAIVAVPIIIDDAYRCAVHNKAVGGVPNSEHQLGQAADIKIAGMTPVEMYRAALQVPAFANGGIGVSESETGYIHVDVRPRVARWCYNLQGQQTIWNPSLDTEVVA